MTKHEMPTHGANAPQPIRTLRDWLDHLAARGRLAVLKPNAPICHPGPMNRGLEISPEAADAAGSLVLDQVSAGVAVRMSVLYHLLAGEGNDAE